jgi:general secretion pathway protein K
MRYLPPIFRYTSLGRGEDRPRGDRGVALLIVIMVVLIVSFLASQLIMQVRTEIRIAGNGKNRAVSQLLSEAGINLALFRLLGDSPLEDETGEHEKCLAGHIYENNLPTGKVRYLAVNESGKIDLNTAPRQLLELFFQFHGLEMEEIEIIIDSIMDWRDSDDLHRLHGAESEFYQNLDGPYIARNGPLQDPAEFFLIRGTGMLRGRLAPEDVFTVHNAGSKINFASLNPAMLDFLVDGDTARNWAYRQAQELDAAFDENTAGEILGEERFELLQNFLNYESSNPYYSIEATGLAGDSELEGEQEGERPGIKIKSRIRIIGSVVHYLSWMEDYEK